MDSDDWSDFVFSMDDMFSGFHFETGYRPLMETYVNGNELHLQAEIPGVDPKDVDMSLEDGHICIIGGLKRAHADEGSCYCVEEISYGAFCRCFHVPEDVEHNKIHAIYDHGILDVGVPFRNSTVG
jgi:HSP20 family protein